MSLGSVLGNGKQCRYYLGRIAYSEFSGQSPLFQCSNKAKAILFPIEELSTLHKYTDVFQDLNISLYDYSSQ